MEEWKDKLDLKLLDNDKIKASPMSISFEGKEDFAGKSHHEHKKNGSSFREQKGQMSTNQTIFRKYNIFFNGAPFFLEAAIINQLDQIN